MGRRTSVLDQFVTCEVASMGQHKKPELTKYFDENIYKKKALQAAVELGYDESVIDQIQKAETEPKIQQIMTTARQNKE